MSFQVHGKDLLGRIGTIKTKSGAFTTPHMFPVLDPNHRSLGKEFFDRVGIHAVMTNAYLLKRGRQGVDPVDVHETLDYPRTVATDSGAYQILEYGHVGVTPEEIIAYQEKINTDIGVILDFPTGFKSDASRARWTVDETVRRADQALEVITRKDILWVGPVQGGVHLKEVERSAQLMARREFDIYALGSPTELMETQRYDLLVDMIVAAKKALPKGKPFHLFGAGHPVLFPFLVALGCDLFDSAAYALYARAGRYLTPEGTLLLGDMVEFVCPCPACVDSYVGGRIEDRRELVLVLAGRWRRPLHEDPRYESVAKAFDDHTKVSICFYSLSWGPVPIELDETFPIAQTEGPDGGDPIVLEERAKKVSDFVQSLHPKRVVLVSDGDYGRAVTEELSKRFAKRILAVLDGEKMKPDAIIKSIERKIVLNA